MFKAARCILVLGVALLAVAGLAACGSGAPGEVLVQIGANSITKATFIHWMAIENKQARLDLPQYTACVAHIGPLSAKPIDGPTKAGATQLESQCEREYQAAQQRVLRSLISFEWVTGEAADEGLKVSDTEVKRRFEQAKRGFFPKKEDLQKYLTITGKTVSDLQLMAELALASARIHKEGKVTKAQIVKYYNENKQSFAVPEQRDVEVIRTRSQAAARKAEREVRSGMSFASVANRVSIDRGAPNSWLVSGIVRSQEDKPLGDAVFSAKPNVLTGPVELHKKYYVFEVKQIRPPSQKTLAEVEASPSPELIAQIQQHALTRFNEAWTTKWTAKTNCHTGYIVRTCRQFKASKENPPEDPFNVH